MRLKVIIAASLLMLTFGVLRVNAQSEADDVEKKIEALLERMTIEEKIGQMNQQTYFELNDTLINQMPEGNLNLFLNRISPTGEAYTKPVNEMARDEKITILLAMKDIVLEYGLTKPIGEGRIGSLLNIVDPVKVNKLQKLAVESRLGIPLIIGRDVIHGFKTIFPIPLGQASSFDIASVEEAAAVSAVEAREKGINWTFAPMLDISRDARWGRIAESLGEDTYLAGEIGAAMVRGFQGKDLSSPNSLVACAKHFVGYGAAEGGRDYNTTNIPEHVMQNVYLPPFRKSLEAGAQTVMTSFNENDGIPVSGNAYLLKELLRKQWGFDGFIVSDWSSVSEMVAHGYAKHEKHAAELSANAGLDMEMFSGTYIAYLQNLIEEEKVSESDIDESVRNILRVKFRMGLFDNPYVDLDKPTQIYSDAHLEKARQSATKSAILLKNNDNILPLNRAKKIAVIGPLADAPHDQLGTWVFDGEKDMTVTPLKALQTEYKDINYMYESGLRFSRDTNTDNFENVKKAVASADVAIVFVGEESILSGEAHSLSNINLIGAQSELIQLVKSVGKPVVMVVMAGRPLTIERDLKYVDAVLYNFHPGTMGGLAIFDLLYGKANPSGKLPVTFVREVGQIPMYYNHNNTGRPAGDKVMTLDKMPLEASQTSLGNTSFYLDSGKDPLYPFGYGLSYSKFEYYNILVSPKNMMMDDSLKVKISIKNTSKVDGTEVAQLYVQDVAGSIVRPVKELKGFQRVFLKAGESKIVEFVLTSNDLKFYGRNKRFEAEPGSFNVWIGPNSRDGRRDSFVLQE